MDPITIGLSAAGMLAGGIGSAIYNRKADKAVAGMAKDNKDLFDAQYYADYTKRSDVQSALGRMRDQLKASQLRNRNTAAVTGATPEAAIASQEADNATLGQTIQGIVGQASAFKDGVQNRYLTQKQVLDNQKIAGYQAKAANFANMASNATTGILGQFATKKEE